jgi:hypothetical protein
MDGRGHNGSPFIDPTVAATMAAGLRQQQLPGGISGPHQQMIDTGSRLVSHNHNDYYQSYR